MNIEEIELEFLDGSCASLAKEFHRRYGYEIFHIFEFNRDDGNENGIIHTLVQIGENKYLDAAGIHSSRNIIKYWYYERGTTIQMTDIFLLDDNLKIKIDLKEDVKQITDTDRIYYEHHKNFVNYDYDRRYLLSDVCEYVMKFYNVNTI